MCRKDVPLQEQGCPKRQLRELRPCLSDLQRLRHRELHHLPQRTQSTRRPRHLYSSLYELHRNGPRPPRRRKRLPRFDIHSERWVERCGDGRNLGYFECDDGNSVNGDGCSADCSIERGYRCEHSSGGKDTCVDVQWPSATLTVEKLNVLKIVFSEPVRSSLNSTLVLDRTCLISPTSRQ